MLQKRHQVYDLYLKKFTKYKNQIVKQSINRDIKGIKANIWHLVDWVKFDDTISFFDTASHQTE